MLIPYILSNPESHIYNPIYLVKFFIQLTLKFFQRLLISAATFNTSYLAFHGVVIDSLKSLMKDVCSKVYFCLSVDAMDFYAQLEYNFSKRVMEKMFSVISI